MALEREIKTYQEHLPELLADSGKYVVVHEEKVIGTYGTYEDALQAGFKEVGVKPFLVKRIESVEQVQFFTRELIASC